jgi:hypothetical protein
VSVLANCNEEAIMHFVYERKHQTGKKVKKKRYAHRELIGSNREFKIKPPRPNAMLKRTYILNRPNMASQNK